MFVDAAFELGKIVLKVLRDVDASKRDSVKLLRSLAGADREEIILQKIGKYWNRQNYFDRPDGLVVVTNHRVVFLSKIKTISTTTDYLSFPLELIEHLEATRVMLVSPAIRFRVQEQQYVFTFLTNSDEVVNAIAGSAKSLCESLRA